MVQDPVQGNENEHTYVTLLSKSMIHMLESDPLSKSLCYFYSMFKYFVVRHVGTVQLTLLTAASLTV